MGQKIQLNAPFELPSKCCVCLGDAEAMRSSKRSEYLPLGVAVQVKMQEFPIPFCMPCLEKEGKRLKCYKRAMTTFFCVMIAFGFLAAMIDKAVVSVPLMGMAALSLGAAIYFGSLERRRSSVQLKQLTERTAILECENREYAELLVKHANGRGRLIPA